MNIPHFVNSPVVDRNGNFTDTWRTIINQLLQELQKNASNAGIVVPNQTTANIAQFTTNNGAIFYDYQTHKVQVCVDGQIKTFTLT